MCSCPVFSQAYKIKKLIRTLRRLGFGPHSGDPTLHLLYACPASTQADPLRACRQTSCQHAGRPSVRMLADGMFLCNGKNFIELGGSCCFQVLAS